MRRVCGLERLPVRAPFAGAFAATGAAHMIDGSHPADHPNALHIGIGAIHRSIAPAASIVPTQLLAHALAIARGREPGTFLHATKVTTRE